MFKIITIALFTLYDPICATSHIHLLTGWKSPVMATSEQGIRPVSETTNPFALWAQAAQLTLFP